jgi:SpoVK/Ycf46/Vps4 family AAA+-type ATPase
MGRVRRSTFERLLNEVNQERNPLVTLWMLRVLVQLGCMRKFVEPDGFEDMRIASYLGLTKLSEMSKQFDRLATHRKIVSLHNRLDNGKFESRLSPAFQKNLARLAGLINLSDVDGRVLEFAVAFHLVPELKNTLGYLGSGMSTREAARNLEVVLQIDRAALAQAFRPPNILAKSGLVKFDLDTRYPGSFESRFQILSMAFAERMFEEEVEPADLIKGAVAFCSDTALELADYSHIGSSLDVLRPYLRKAVIERRPGVNIYIYGPPGTGKTELAKVLAHDVGCKLYEVAYKDEDGDLADSMCRLKAFGAAQSFFAHDRAMILFDEVESIFKDERSPLGRDTSAERKAWLNRTLETNPVPAIWISNSVDIDRAFLRRFDMILEIPVPPRTQRQAIIRNNCDGLLSEDAIRRISEPERLSPALIARSSAVIKAVSDNISKEKVSGAIEELINSSLRAQGHRALVKKDKPNATRYDLRFVNVNVDLERLSESVRSIREGRFCFHGASGTGKTAFARWLAEQAEMPLVIKRASDLLDPFVGGTEQKIAEAFAEAKDTKFALLVDEFDSFLQDRRSAVRNWEISQVNEMLVQLEEFQGVFIATTNRIDAMDPAILRRFDMKIEFGCLSLQQLLSVFGQHCQMLGLGEPSAEVLGSLRRLTNTTIGDFAVVSRQSRLNRISSPEMLLSRMQEECAFRDETRRPIGFLN